MAFACVRSLPFAALVLVGTLAQASSLSGLGRAIDGDSLIVGQTEVRLFGIDAPEFAQSCARNGQPWPCGSASADQLSKMITGKQVNCVSLGTDPHGRVLARCSVGAIDLNRTMVAAGYAVAFRRYSMDYLSAEESAKANKRGIWSGTFELPSQFRHSDGEHVIVSPKVEPPSGSTRPVVTSIRSKPQPSGVCRIKGNHSRRGEKIYHLPGRPYYEETVAEEIFCTERDARAAGYRRSRAH